MIGITIVLVVLLGFVAAEFFFPDKVHEGFQSVIPVLSPGSGYFAKFVPRRGDIAPDSEEAGYIQDPRYFRGYVDVQRLGVPHDFCRMVESKADGSRFFACALAGTENLSGIKFRTPSTKDGFRLSRDDYMRDTNGDGRSDYCRILKGRSGQYEPLCNRANDLDFYPDLVVDPQPPADTQMLLRFYDGCVLWYRFWDDMRDYIEGTQLLIAGGLKVDEKPNQPVAEGLRFNGIDQFLRLGDTPDLELGYKVPLRSLRGLMMWVYFEEFTNNAHILDFGNGAGKNNIVLGIVGKGDAVITDAALIRPPLICGEESTVPTGPSGAQAPELMTPQEAMKTTCGNVNEYDCAGWEGNPRRLPPSRAIDRVVKGDAEKATLLYEIWDEQQRKMRVRVPSVIPKRKWTHIAITAESMDAFRPAIAIYVNGEKVFVEASGFLPQASILDNCYLGRSNWSNDTSQFENRDELFQGRMADVRGYKKVLDPNMIKDSVAWGRAKLGLEKVV